MERVVSDKKGSGRNLIEVSSKLAEAVTLLACVRVMSGSNHGLVTGCILGLNRVCIHSR